MKAFTKFLSLPANFKYICDSPNETEKRRRIDELRARFDTVGFSGVINGVGNTDGIGSVSPVGQTFPKSSNYFSINFSADIADYGNESGIYDGDDFAEYNAKTREVAAMSDIRRLTLSSTIKDNLKGWILKKNNISKRNRERQKEKEEAEQNPNVSRPFWD